MKLNVVDKNETKRSKPKWWSFLAPPLPGTTRERYSMVNIWRDMYNISDGTTEACLMMT